MAAFKTYDGDNNEFRHWCEKAGVKPTRRQYGKYLRGLGKAAGAKREAERYTVARKA